MDQWVSVLVAGLVGGGAITMLRGGSGPWPAFLEKTIAEIEKEHPWWALLVHLPHNGFYGAMASFLVWTLGTAGADFSAAGLPAPQWGTFIVVGMGGGYTVHALYQRAQKADALAKVAANLAEALERLAESGPGASPGPGAGTGP